MVTLFGHVTIKWRRKRWNLEENISKGDEHHDGAVLVNVNGAATSISVGLWQGATL
jgi:hypothetical protein